MVVRSASGRIVLDEVLNLGLEDFFKFCKQLRYGWVDENGVEHGTENFTGYGLSSPEKTVKYGVGICWDQTELQRAWFERQGYEFATFLLYYYVNDDNCPSHSILAYQEGGGWYWFEPMFHQTEVKYCGIHKYQSLAALLVDLRRVFVKNGKMSGMLPQTLDLQRWNLYWYQKPEYGISDEKFFTHCRQGKDMKVELLKAGEVA